MLIEWLQEILDWFREPSEVLLCILIRGPRTLSVAGSRWIQETGGTSNSGCLSAFDDGYSLKTHPSNRWLLVLL